MAKSISEFITEQETGAASTGSDNLVKAYAECAAAISLAKCYAEQAVIMEFAAENSIESINIVQESADDKKENIFKRAAGAVGNAWTKIVEFFKAIFRKVSGFVADKRMVTLKKMLEDVPEGVELTGIKGDAYKFPAFLEAFNETVGVLYDGIIDGAAADDEKIEECLRVMDKIVSTDEHETEKGIERGTQVWSSTKIKELFGKEYEKGRVQSVLKGIDKSINDLDKAVKKAAKEDDKITADEKKKISDNLTKVMNSTIKAYDISLKDFGKAYDSIKSSIEKYKKDNKESKTTTESFYFV